MKMIKICGIAIICLFWVLLSSCATRIDAVLASNGSLSMNMGTSLQPRISALIERMYNASGQEGLILNATLMADSLSDAPGVTSVSFRNTSSSAIEGNIRISQINEFLTVTGETKFINYEQSPSGGRCEITINRENGPEIIDLLSFEISDYLNALMAPIVTGEELSTKEYLDLVASFYNKPISDEIASSRVNISVDFPGPITSIKGGTFLGRRATFNIPLLELLVLETPMVFEVRWN